MSAPRRGLARAAQGVGFVGALALLGWCLARAANAENRAQLARLSDAAWWQVALLAGLTAATVTINGLIFWVVVRPERRLRATDVVATNAVSTMLAYAPFKLSAAARVAIHHRRDRVRLVTIAAWFSAFAALLLAGLGPIALASLWRGEIDAIWAGASAGGTVVAVGAVVSVASVFAGKRGLRRAALLVRRLGLGWAARLVPGRILARLAGLFRMLGHPGAAAAATALRLADVGVHTARVVLAGQILGIVIGWDDAVLVSAAYFLIGVLSPFGMLGVREAGAAGVARLLGFGEASEGFLVAALLIGAAEAVVNSGLGVAGAAWLRLDRLFRRR